MHLSYYKRPLLLLLIAYILVIFAVRVSSPKKHRQHFSGTPSGTKSTIAPVGATSSYSPQAKIECIVDTHPHKIPGSYKFTASIVKINDKPEHGKLIVYLDDGLNKLSPYNEIGLKDRIIIEGRIDRPFSYPVPGNLDWNEYLENKGIIGEIQAISIEKIKDANFVFKMAGRFHRYILNVFDSRFATEHSAILSGIVMGEKKKIPAELKADFQDSGAMHLLVASGSNVGFVAFVVYFLCAKIGLKKRYSSFITLLVSGFYVLSAGLDPPLVRAYIMFLFGLFGYVIGRESGAFQGLIISCFLILLFEPKTLFDVGFQMSFIATLGIVIGISNWHVLAVLPVPSFSLHKRFGVALQHIFKGLVWFARKVLLIMMVSFFAQSGLYPIMALYFHKVSIISVISNIIFVPVAGLIMTLGFLLALFAKVYFINEIFVWSTKLVVTFFKESVEFFANLPFSSTWISAPNFWTGLGYFIFIFLIWNLPILTFRSFNNSSSLMGKGIKSKRVITVMFFILSLSAILLGKILPQSSKLFLFSDKNTNCIINVVNDSLFLINPGINGRQLTNSIFDIGTGKVRAVFLTSLNKSNWSGLKVLSENVLIKNLFLPYGEISKELESILKELSKKGVKIKRLWPGEEVTIPEYDVTVPIGETTGGDCLKIKARWPLFATKEKIFFRQKGYSGHEIFNKLSLMFWAENFVYETSGNADFIRVYKDKNNSPIHEIFIQKGELKIIKY